MTTHDYKYFSGDKEVKYYGIMRNAEFAENFPGIKPHKSCWYDSFSKMIALDSEKQIVPVTRIIRYKKNPSLHKCDSRCMNATGNNCECSCGGANHGINS